MKQLVKSTFLLLAFLVPAIASAHDFEVDGIYYTILNGNEASVTYKGGSYNSYTNEYSGDVVIPETVTNNGTTYSVTSIGVWAFAICDALRSVDVPNTVTSISERAFSGCSGLESIEFPNSMVYIGPSAFCGCSSLTSIVIPNTVTNIGYKAFELCKGLTSIVIPASVTAIGVGAFRYCSGLTSITVDDGNPAYDSRENCNAIIETRSNTIIAGCMNSFIPNSVTSIGDVAFEGCSGLTTIEIPSTVTSIGYSTFSACSGLASIEIPNSITYLDDWVFSYCDALTSVVIPNSVTRIGACAFYDCEGLESVSLGNSVTTVGVSAFEWCENLRSVGISSSVTNISAQAFSGCSRISNVSCLATTPPTIEYSTFVCYENAILGVPEESLDAYQNDDYWSLFMNIQPIGPLGSDICVDGIYYHIDGNQATVTGYAEIDYSGHVDIPAKLRWQGMTYEVTAIGDEAFYYCYDLHSVSIPNTVTSIGTNAFAGCELYTIMCFATTPPSIDETSFDCYWSATLEVPEDAMWTYETDMYWGGFYIQPLFCDFCVDGIYYKIIDGTNVSVVRSPNYGYRGIVDIPINVVWEGTAYTVTAIGDAAFVMCQDLTDVIIPYSVTSIGETAFEGCTGLSSIYIPNSVTSIGSGVFMNCSSLSYIVVDGDNPVYDSRDYCYGIIETATNTLIAACPNTTIPETVTAIGNSAFSGCYYAPQIDIPNSVTSIGDYAFSQCWNLTDLTLPSSVTSIGNMAFGDCQLSMVQCFAVKPPTITEDTFGYYNDATLVVPPVSVQDYKNHQYWGQFRFIDAMDTDAGDLDADGNIGISDLSSLIDLLLTSGSSVNAADVDGNGKVDISDVSSLIDKILSGE